MTPDAKLSSPEPKRSYILTDEQLSEAVPETVHPAYAKKIATSGAHQGKPLHEIGWSHLRKMLKECDYEYHELCPCIALTLKYRAGGVA